MKENALIDTQFNLALTQEAVSAAVPDREYLIWRDRRFTYAQLTERSRRLASYLHQCNLGARVERDLLAGHESGQDHVALYMRNCNEFIEAMLGAFKSRTVPVNVNYRYVADELRYLFGDARARAVIYHAEFAPQLAKLRDALPEEVVLIQVPDDSGTSCSLALLISRSRWHKGRPCRLSRCRPTTCISSTPAVPPACPRPFFGDSTTSSCRRWAGSCPVPGSR